VRSWRRPCHCSTTTGLDEPSATFTVRPVSSASDPAPIAIMTGSRTATASGPTVSAARAVRSATTAPSAKASNVAISPIQISPYPSSSATCAVRTTSAAGRSCHSPSDTDSLGLSTASFYHSVSCIVTATMPRPPINWMRGLVAPDSCVLHMSAKYPTDPIYAPR
jgi:hypothetical protein